MLSRKKIKLEQIEIKNEVVEFVLFKPTLLLLSTTEN